MQPAASRTDAQGGDDKHLHNMDMRMRRVQLPERDALLALQPTPPLTVATASNNVLSQIRTPAGGRLQSAALDRRTKDRYYPPGGIGLRPVDDVERRARPHVLAVSWV